MQIAATFSSKMIHQHSLYFCKQYSPISVLQYIGDEGFIILCILHKIKKDVKFPQKLSFFL